MIKGKRFLALSLGICLALTGCGKKNKEENTLEEITTTEVTTESQGYVTPDPNTEEVASDSDAEEDEYVLDLSNKYIYTYPYLYSFILPSNEFDLEFGEVYSDYTASATYSNVYTNEFISLSTYTDTNLDYCMQSVNDANSNYTVLINWEDYVDGSYSFKHIQYQVDEDWIEDVFVHQREDGKFGIITCMLSVEDEWGIMLNSIYEVADDSSSQEISLENVDNTIEESIDEANSDEEDTTEEVTTEETQE
jgi:hypothetical protein